MVQTHGRATVRRMPNPHFAKASPHSLLSFRGITATIPLFLVLLIGCDRNIEPYQPGEEASPPDLGRIFPGPPPGAGPEGVAIETDRGPTRGALPPTRTEGSETPVTASASSGAAPIEGRIELSGDAPAGGVLFVIARRQGAQGGPPLAVLRIGDPSFPLDFSIGPDNVMIPSMRFEGAISLSARLDEDGSAMTRGAGDLSSAVEEPLSPGTTGVRLVLSEQG
jgi:hypothetical protein